MYSFFFFFFFSSIVFAARPLTHTHTRTYSHAWNTQAPHAAAVHLFVHLLVGCVRRIYVQARTLINNTTYLCCEKILKICLKLAYFNCYKRIFHSLLASASSPSWMCVCVWQCWLSVRHWCWQMSQQLMVWQHCLKLLALPDQWQINEQLFWNWSLKWTNWSGSDGNYDDDSSDSNDSNDGDQLNSCLSTRTGELCSEASCAVSVSVLASHKKIE